MERAPGTAWRAAPVSFKTFAGMTIAEGKRLIVGTDQAVFASRPGWLGQRSLASTGGPRPPASRGGGGRCRGTGQQVWLRQREFASIVVRALRPHVFWVEDVSSASVWGRESRHHRGAVVLRPAGVHSGRALRESPLHVAWRPSNHALHRAPPRNALGQATTSGCTPRGARSRHRVEGGAGELQNVQRLEIAEEKRLILNWSQAVHASRRSWPERARRASAGAPRPAASVCGGGRSLGAAEPSWRRIGWLASGIGSALRTSSGRAVLFPGGEVVGFAPRALKGGAVLRETVVPSEATPSKGSLRVAQEPLNPAPAPGGSAAGEAQHR
jgi:hypothetical protein